MKKIIFILLAGFLMSTAFAQDVDKKAERKAKKEKEKQEQIIEYNAALQLLLSRRCVVPVEKIIFEKGEEAFPEESINFLKFEGDSAIIQLAPRRPKSMGHNGLGGFTIEGEMRNIKEDNDEQRNIYTLSFSMSGAVGRVMISLRLKESGLAQISINNLLSGERLSFQGPVEPYGETKLFQGSDL